MLLSRKIFTEKKILNSIKTLMEDADKAILKIYNSIDFGNKIKKDDTPVTKADLAAHNVLLSGLKALTPDIPIVSEEDAKSHYIPRNNSIYWLIDPLDGTKEFIKRNGEFTCNLALIEHNKPTLGFITIPAKNELYFGGKSFGAFVKNLNKELLQLKHYKKAGVTRIVASKSHLNEETKKFINKQLGKIEIVQAGSSLKFLKIASGEADLYPRLAPTCEWDTAAGHAILEGAGGQVLQAYNNKPLIYGKSEILNPHFIASILN